MDQCAHSMLMYYAVGRAHYVHTPRQRRTDRTERRVPMTAARIINALPMYAPTNSVLMSGVPTNGAPINGAPPSRSHERAPHDARPHALSCGHVVPRGSDGLASSPRAARAPCVACTARRVHRAHHPFAYASTILLRTLFFSTRTVSYKSWNVFVIFSLLSRAAWRAATFSLALATASFASMSCAW